MLIPDLHRHQRLSMKLRVLIALLLIGVLWACTDKPVDPPDSAACKAARMAGDLKAIWRECTPTKKDTYKGEPKQ